MATEDSKLREQLVELLAGRSAHIDLQTALDGFPVEKRHLRPAHADHSAWQLLWHMQFTVRDLLQFCTDSRYLAPEWPEAYWPGDNLPSGVENWEACARGLEEDLEAFRKMVRDPATNLDAAIPWGEGQTILREVLLAADHTSYHLGQLVQLRKMLEGDGRES